MSDTNTFDEYYKSYNKERADLNLIKTATSKNITVSDWNKLTINVETLIKNIENAYTFLQNTLGVFGSVYSDIGNTANSVTALGDSIDTSIGNGELWSKLTIDGTTLASAKISAIEAMFANYVVEYDAANHKIKVTKNGKESVSPVIVDEGNFGDLFGALITDYAKKDDPDQTIKANSVEANSVKAETPNTDGKYLVNRDTLNDALTKLINDVQADIARVVSSVYVYKGSKPTHDDLPKDASNGHVYSVETAYGVYPAGTNYVWNGSVWEVLTGFIDTSKFLEKLSGTKLVYTVDGGIGYAESATGSTIPVRDSSGHVKTYAPANDDDAATKSYVDSGLAKKADSFSPYLDAPFTIGAITDTGGKDRLAVNYGAVLGEPTVPLYDGKGRLSCANPNAGTDAVNLDYLNAQFKDISDFLGKLVDGGIS